ncbi:MAG TPA: precorrin-6y C5,15-methyltransferase (decarboxylating) subunit CbiE [Propionibacteriaceae bacterium]|nr:precorrin-6y C5,15-methyltransferase (decarboxylating) subunit CbiE [Propionibacteriaceae bacterium]
MIDVVGIDAVGWASLGPAERDLLTAAELVVGSPRHLGLLPPVPGQRREPLPADLRGALPDLLAEHERETTVVLASGDPLVAGIGRTVLDLFSSGTVRVHPHISSLALARARMGWDAETVQTVRLRTEDDLDLIRRWLFPGQRIVVLSRDAATPAQVARLLAETGHADSTVTVLSHLGGPDEARHAADEVVPALNVVCIEVQGPSPYASLTAGLPDEAYEHDGQLTKRDVRASALAHLMPRPGELLWDVGAGAGSIGIEWARAHPRCRAVAVERDPDRAKRIAANAASLGVPGLTVVHGTAPDALADLPRPDAVFVGGGADDRVIDAGWAALRPGGRLVVHAVTLETEAVITARWREQGGTMIRLAVEHLERIGGYHGWKPARTVVQWSVTKPVAP